jgi:hypothetical protein
MGKFRKLICLLILYQTVSNNILVSGQETDSSSFQINSRFSFLTYEKSTEMLLHLPQNLIYNKLRVSLKINNDTIAFWEGIPGRRILRIPVELNLQPAYYTVIADIRIPGRTKKYIAVSDLAILYYKRNEVKTDRFTGGLIVNKKLFFPFGFYCYSPVYPTLPEEEAVKGFNLMSPYQRILPETFNERKAYMDRCAQLGMKVHYNLLSVSGGGGVSSRIEGLTDEEKKESLINEVLDFRDHPALLAWYISDEPTGNKVSPEFLESVYKTVKEADPWHPVSIVFMAPFMSSVKYANALDIVMADPYPVPVSPVTMAGDIAGQLSNEFHGKKPVWIVPQAFGGGEWWEREPTLQEIRAMTYQSIIKGARGIQFFVRQGLNLFPKSAATWGECGRMALEIAELTPWLLSDEEIVQVRSVSQNIIVTSSVHDGTLMIIAANRTNSPQSAGFTIAGKTYGKARVIFENRTITINSGYLADYLPAFGTQVYMIDLKASKEANKPYPGNLLSDPGFENTASPGIPASCYARSGGDRGATFFTDTREHFEGSHSLRIVTPAENKSIKLRFFPIEVSKGQTYFISVRAKADQEINIPQNFEISFGEFGTARFELTNEWKEFVTNVTIPYYNELPPRTNLILQMPSEGVAWFDLLQVFEATDIHRSINPEIIFPDDWW